MEYASEKCWKDRDRIQAYLRKVTVLMILTLSCDGHVVVYQEGILHFNSTLNYYPPFEVVLKKTTEIIRRCWLTLLHTIGILQSDDMLMPIYHRAHPFSLVHVCRRNFDYDLLQIFI